MRLVETEINSLNNVKKVNSHTSKKFTPHNSSWFCGTKGIGFAKVTRDRVMSKHEVIVHTKNREK